MTLDLFKKGGGRLAANELEVPYLGSLPFDPGIVRGGDDGVHRIVAEPEGETAIAFDYIVNNITNSLDEDSSTTLKII
jgi:ATP-binding protein involved in chromosome partitioning